jgi:drug/metabolite transporter (DMT)-like permease
MDLFHCYNNFVFHLFNNQKGRGKSKTIVGEIPTIDFTFFSYFLPYKMGVLNEKRCKSSGTLALIFISIFIFKESYKPHQFIGILFILLGIYLASTKKLVIPF